MREGVSGGVSEGVSGGINAGVGISTFKIDQTGVKSPVSIW